MSNIGNKKMTFKRPFSNAKDIIEIYGIIHAETKMAIFVDVGNNTVWLLKSQIEDWPNVGESGEILMPEWLAKDKCII